MTVELAPDALFAIGLALGIALGAVIERLLLLFWALRLELRTAQVAQAERGASGADEASHA